LKRSSERAAYNRDGDKLAVDLRADSEPAAVALSALTVPVELLNEVVGLA
jgi:hypothetical protein